MQIRDLEEQLAALQKAVGASQQAKDAIAAAGNTSLLVPRQTSDSYDYNMEHQHREEMDEDFAFHPKVESPHPHSAPPEPMLATSGQALTEELSVILLNAIPIFPVLIQHADDLLLLFVFDIFPRELSPDRTTPIRLHVFLQYRRRCAFECDEGRFAIQFQAPADSPDALHPGLVSAVLLLGYHFASTASILPSILSSHRQANNVADLEAYFLQQTCDKLAKSLTGADRLGDFLRGTALLVWYYFAKGRIAEAQYHASGNVYFYSLCSLFPEVFPSFCCGLPCYMRNVEDRDSRLP